MTNPMREVFEKWAASNGYTLLSLVPDEDLYARSRRGKYKDHMVQLAFEAWQSRQPEIDALITDRNAQPDIIDAEQLRAMSGKRTAAAVRRWASAQGIQVRDGKGGPWTTVEAVNAAMGVGSANESAYRAEEVL